MGLKERGSPAPLGPTRLVFFFMQIPRSVSIFFASVTLFVTTTALALAADSTVRSALGTTAGSSGFKNICGSTSCVATVVGAVINILLGLMGVALVGYILYAGFLWMTAGGEDKQTESARDMVRNAVIGFVIMGASYTMASVGIRLVGDTFTASEPAPLAEQQGSTPTTATPGATPTPSRSNPQDPYGLGCTRASCIPLCIEQECVGPLRAQARFTCETGCQNTCNSRCAASGPPPPGETSGCDTNTCENLCMREHCPRALDGTLVDRSDEALACRSSCHSDCTARLCTTDARTGVTRDVPRASAETCRASAGYRRCYDACRSAAETATASVTPEFARRDRYEAAVEVCGVNCSRDNCSP